MKKLITFTTITILLAALALVVMIDAFGQGPKQAIDQTSETHVFETISEQQGEVLVKNPSQLKTGEGGRIDCPDRETMIGNPMLSIECFLYKEYFDEAYELYPNIPKGILETVASMSDFKLLHITQADYSHPWDAHDVPRTYTVMGYYDLPGYEPDYNNLALVSNLSGSSQEEIISSPSVSIRAYAKVFSTKMLEENIQSNDWVGITEIFSSLDHRQNGTLGDKSNKVLFLNLLTSLERARLLEFPQYEIDVEFVVESFSHSINKSTRSLCSDYLGVDYDERALPCNYGNRSLSASIDKITIHTIEGSSSSAKDWFQNCQSNVSAHYISGEYPNGSNEESIIQSVCESDKAQHIGIHNSSSIGIEHAGNANSTLFSADFYQESAILVSDIASRYPDINPLAMYTGPAHSVTTLIPECLDIKGHQHFDISANTASYKYDPGDTWDWFYYYGLINDNPIQTNSTASSGSFFDSGGSGGNYGLLENRTYRINPGVSLVTLDITSFNLATGDYLWIYDKPNPNIGPNPHNNTNELGIGSNAPHDVPVANFYAGTLGDIPTTSFVSSHGGFYIVFRSDCETQSAGFHLVWNTPAIPSCGDIFEPNNSASQAHALDLAGSGISFEKTLDGCIEGSSDDDWYEVLLLEPGLMTVTLAEDAPYDLNISSNPNMSVSVLGNNNKQLTFCHRGNSCFPLQIRIWDPGFFSNTMSGYNLTFEWNTNISCVPDNLGAMPSTPKLGSTGLSITSLAAYCNTQTIEAFVSGGSGSYTWYIDGVIVGTGHSLDEQVSGPGTYTILVIDNNNLCLTAWDDVVVPTGNATPSISPSAANIVVGGSVQLSANGGSSYSWSPSAGLSNSNIWNPIASPSSTTTYTVSVSDGLGCTSTASVTVVVSGNAAVPGNNTPCNAEILAATVNSCSFTTGTNVGATNSGVIVDPLCGSTSYSGNTTGNYSGGDIWYKIFVPTSGSVLIQTQQQSSLNDAVIAAYTGSCNNLTMVACADDQSTSNYMPIMTLNSLTPNTWVYIRVWEFGNNVFGSFGICATTTGGGGAGSSGPDLVMKSFSVDDHTVDQGDRVEVDFVIRNQGTQASPACFYMCGLANSLQANLVTGGLMSFASVPALAPNTSHSFSLTLDIPSVDDGTYYLIAAADETFDNIAETNENNNIAGTIITVGNVIPDGVDLDVTTRYLSQTSGLQPGIRWEVGLEIENDGTEDAIGTSALVVLSEDNDYNPGIDIVVWQFNTSDLDPGEEDYDEKWVTFPMVPYAGTWKVLFIADANNQIAELDESNNISRRTISVATINPATADYVTAINDLRDKTTGLYLVNDQIPAYHELEIFTGTTNQGLIRPDVASRTSFHVSPLPYPIGIQCRIGVNTHSNAGISVGGTDNSSPDDYLRGVQVGTNYIIVRTDYREEIYEGPTGESNNFLAYPIEITYDGLVADLVPRIISMVPYSNALGDAIVVTTRVYNYGDTMAYDFLLRHWVSADDQFDGRDIDGRLEQTLAGVDSLAAGDSIDVVRYMSIDNDPSAPDVITSIGQYYLLAVVDEECEDVVERSVLNNVSSMPIYISDISCFVNMKWHYDVPIDTVSWDATNLDWIKFDAPDDCEYTITTSPWITSPFTSTWSGETVEYPMFAENITGVDRVGCIYAGDEDSICFVQKAEPSILLPVTWISVDAYEFEGDALIYWRVGVEYNVSHYRIERSLDGIYFFEIGTINSNNEANSRYQFLDELYNYTVYYRVIAVDYDGDQDVSTIVVLTTISKDDANVYNLTQHSGRYALEAFGRITYHIYSMLGQIMYSDECDSKEICSISMYQPGMYLLVIQHHEDYYVEKLIF